MKLDELVLLQRIMEKEVYMAEERSIYIRKCLTAKENQMIQGKDEETDECILEERKELSAELREADDYKEKVKNILDEISGREFSII